MPFIFFKAVLKTWFYGKNKCLPEDDLAPALPGLAEIPAFRSGIRNSEDRKHARQRQDCAQHKKMALATIHKIQHPADKNAKQF